MIGENKSIKVHVPATTANLGPGFDCLGMALDLWNTVVFSISDQTNIQIQGEGSNQIKADKSNLVYSSAIRLFEEIGTKAPEIDIRCQNNIPLARGLGSSAAAIVAGLIGANALADNPLSEMELLKIATNIEGHADNVAPAILGGFQIVAQTEENLIASSVSIPEELMAVVFIPDMPMPTDKARSILASDISLEDTIFNLSRVALLVNSFSNNNLENLMTATEDKIHQPKRSEMFPAMKYVFRAARSSGALAVFLSGGGSSVTALANSRFLTIGYEMSDAADKVGVPGQVKILRPSTYGGYTSESYLEEQ
tara:strand:+ start:1858 stop:2787 length:930 start_codon:yes stop_codon:yes gene_type:complete